MGPHSNTVFKNSCLKVPIDPVNRLPIASYERPREKESERSKSVRSLNISVPEEKSSISFKEFYRSIPDYKDVNHLSNQEFYLKLEKLRESKHKLLRNFEQSLVSPGKYHKNAEQSTNSFLAKSRDYCDNVIEKYVSESDLDSLMSDNFKRDYESFRRTEMRKGSGKLLSSPHSSLKFNPGLEIIGQSGLTSPEKNEEKIGFSGVSPIQQDTLSRKSLSVPSSPVKNSPSSKRDSDKKILSQLREYSKELEHAYLEKDKNRKHFKANPVPIESRIPLFDKIMEDQELRRAITKLQSTAELQAQMKPFSFTEREEKQGAYGKMGCSRLYKSNPQLNVTSPSIENEIVKRKRFRARPVPKNLFSNYIYDKMKEDDFYRALNRKIRAEELLKVASLPPSMASRQMNESKCKSSSCQQYHNNYQENNSDESNNKIVSKRKSRSRKRNDDLSPTKEIDDFDLSKYDVSPSRKGKHKHRNKDEVLKKIYGSTSSDTVTPSSGYITRPHSENDMSAINKSNLAAILRIESSKKKLEADILKQLEEERFQSEMKWRDSVLRRKPAWKSLKYSQGDDFTLRLQMRRDEERLRREQFLHEMELMYGRVHSQPMMFERSYSPDKLRRRRRPSSKSPSKRVSSTKPSRSAMSKNQFLSSIGGSPTRSRKVSINETAETIKDDIDDYLRDKYDDADDVFSKSSEDDDDDGVPEDIAPRNQD